MQAAQTSSDYIGCAGWSIRKELADRFPADGSHLTRYAGRFHAVEINSSFYRAHRPATYARWAASVSSDFRFAVKLPKTITHQRRLGEVSEILSGFLSEVSELGDKLGPLLVQLPPSLKFSEAVADGFFAEFRKRFPGEISCEPRHISWFTPSAENLLRDVRVARVSADPAVAPESAQPGGWPGLIYYRLHGTPKMYYSSYSDEYLDALANKIASLASTAPVWCIFDNTALGASTVDAMHLQARLERLGRSTPRPDRA